MDFNIADNIKTLINDVLMSPILRLDETKTQAFCEEYRSANIEAKSSIVLYIIKHYYVDSSLAESATRNFLANKNHGDAFTVKSIEKVRQILTPKYLVLFNKIGRLENGVKFLVDLRGDILNVINHGELNENEIRHLRLFNEHLKNMLSLWFSVGFLNLERVTWDSSCDLMQKISEYEAVHPIRSWPDLKRRVGLYRRCYVFHHSCLPKEPLVILHVALTEQISSSIRDIVSYDPYFGGESNVRLNQNQTEEKDKIHAAVFYSVSSPHKGLNGIELGTQIIRRVVREIRSELPHVTTFSTLSPIPGFRDYLLAEIQAHIKDEGKQITNFASSDELTALNNHFFSSEAERQNAGEKGIWSELLRRLKSGSWHQDAKLSELLREPLMRKCAHYLYSEKRRGFALNPVAHFHLRNGAVMWRLNWRADCSPRGMTNSCGLMINYRYYLDEMDKNAEQYSEHQVAQISKLFAQHLLNHRSNL